jgi:hypothetical protein
MPLFLRRKRKHTGCQEKEGAFHESGKLIMFDADEPDMQQRNFSVNGLYVVLILILLTSISNAETTCSVKDCEIKITVKIAFIGANDTYINNAENEIESTWNGPNGFQTYGECKCKVKFEVETKKVTNQANCTPAIAGYHCVMVTNFFNATGQYDNPPRNQTNISGAEVYIGYMYGVASGNGSNSQKGWWSDIMSRPVPGSTTGETYKDFAHEAGHMMGLEDGDGGIMNNTSGPNSGPTQANIDEIVNDICGAGACPDKCCCGNGKVDMKKGEQCDPKANPVGCSAGLQCCPVCCSCYGPICSAKNGAYLSQSECKSKCTSGSTCFKDFKSGCWKCLKSDTNVTDTCLDPTNIRGREECDHPVYGFGKGVDKIIIVPVAGGLFSDERMNFEIKGMGDAYVILRDGNVSDYGMGHLSDPTMNIYTDSATVSRIYGGELTMSQALREDMISIEGVGFFNSMKVGLQNFFIKNLGFEEEYMPIVEDPFPKLYYESLEFEILGNDSDPLSADLPDMPFVTN